MKQAITFIVFFLFSCNSSNLDCSNYYLIRHAEKVRLNPEDKDPELNEAGKERALVWKEYFNELEIAFTFLFTYFIQIFSIPNVPFTIIAQYIIE